MSRATRTTLIWFAAIAFWIAMYCVAIGVKTDKNDEKAFASGVSFVLTIIGTLLLGAAVSA